MADQITSSLAEAKILVMQGMKGEDGFSPTVEVQDIVQSLPGGGTEVIGHKVIITDANGQHIFNVMDGEDGEGGGGVAEAVLYIAQSLTAVQKEQARSNIGAGTYEKPSGGIPASDLAPAVQTSLGEADTALQPAALQTELDENVSPERFVLVRNGNTLTTVDTFISIVSLLFSTPRRVMFFIVASQSGGTVTSALELYPTMIDANSRALTLVGYLDGYRYTAELTAASASSTMTGTLTVEPIVTQSDIPTAVSELTNDSGFQTATQVQSAIAAIPDELPDTTSASANDFLCLNAQKQPIWKTVPSAESNSFGGGS